MIVKNEAICLPLILADIQGLADELIIVDTGSTDQTIAIAKKMGAQVISQPWIGDFSAARNRSIEDAKSGWILWLDADDRMEAEEVKRLQSLKSILRPDCIYSLQVVNQVADGFSPPFMQTRLFPNDRRLRFENRIHESITGNAAKHGFKTVHLPVRIVHTGYAKPEDLLMKMERNMLSLEEELKRNPDSITLRFLYANTLVYFNRFQEAQHHYEHITTTPGAREIQGDVYQGTLVALANIHYQVSHYQEAARWAQHAVEDQPQNMQGWHQWGKALMRLNQNEAALDKFSRALACRVMSSSSLQVDYSSVRCASLEAATTILTDLNRAQEAEILLQDALQQEASPRIYELLAKLKNVHAPSEEELLLKGQALLDKQAYIEASKTFIHIIETYPHSFQAFNGLGLIAWYFGKFNDAYMLFKQSVQIDPLHEEILLNLWDAAQATGQVDDARAMLQDVLHRNPGIMKIKELLEE